MEAKLKNCQQCGKLFMARPREKICPACQDAEREMEPTVVNYVRDHPKCKVQDVLEGTGAPESLVRRLIREGRFEQLGVAFGYPCKKCGKEIYSGQYCENCLKDMQDGLHSVQTNITKNAEAARGHGMYSKDLQQQKK